MISPTSPMYKHFRALWSAIGIVAISTSALADTASPDASVIDVSNIHAHLEFLATCWRVAKREPAVTTLLQATWPRGSSFSDCSPWAVKATFCTSQCGEVSCERKAWSCESEPPMSL